MGGRATPQKPKEQPKPYTHYVVPVWGEDPDELDGYYSEADAIKAALEMGNGGNGSVVKCIIVKVIGEVTFQKAIYTEVAP